MKNLFDATTAEEVKQRIARLRPDSPRQWGTMSPGQAAAHCSAGIELATGERKPPRNATFWVLGWIIKPIVLGNDSPMRRNSPTMIAVEDDRNLDVERERLLSLVERFVAAGPEVCTTHPHSFFGRLTPMEWAILAYKHLDHHLRQFGV
jgi:hypothetical protein